jgi:aminoglycoside 3-N-acetyltransferase
MLGTPELLLDLYAALGLRRGQVVYIGSDFGRMITSPCANKHELMAAHLDAIRALVGVEGTVVVPVATLNLCNTDIVFDPATTPSRGMGVFSEFVRVQPGARRSFHPFWSLAALGAQAAEIVEDAPRHAFGYDSPWARLVSADAVSLHIGVQPRHSFSVIHHIELVVGVPYRYTKEFLHPVQRPNGVCIEPFYHFVCYRDMDIERDRNAKIYAHFEAHSTILEAKHARGGLWSYPMRAFYDVTARFLAHDLYGWLAREPAIRPYSI